MVKGSRRCASSEGREEDCGRIGCRFARSGETVKSGVPGEAGKLNFGSMQFKLPFRTWKFTRYILVEFLERQYIRCSFPHMAGEKVLLTRLALAIARSNHHVIVRLC